MPPRGLRVDTVEMELENTHMSVAMSNLVMELADYAVQRQNNYYTEEEVAGYGDSDRFQNYVRYA